MASTDVNVFTYHGQPLVIFVLALLELCYVPLYLVDIYYCLQTNMM
jgi:hypothetical protein